MPQGLIPQRHVAAPTLPMRIRIGIRTRRSCGARAMPCARAMRRGALTEGDTLHESAGGAHGRPCNGSPCTRRRTMRMNANACHAALLFDAWMVPGPKETDCGYLVRLLRRPPKRERLTRPIVGPCKRARPPTPQSDAKDGGHHPPVRTCSAAPSSRCRRCCRPSGPHPLGPAAQPAAPAPAPRLLAGSRRGHPAASAADERAAARPLPCAGRARARRPARRPARPPSIRGGTLLPP